jgi:hypothetical protein
LRLRVQPICGAAASASDPRWLGRTCPAPWAPRIGTGSERPGRPEVPWAHGTGARELRVRRSPRKPRGGMNTKTQRLTGERERWWPRAARPERPCRPSRIERRWALGSEPLRLRVQPICGAAASASVPRWLGRTCPAPWAPRIGTGSERPGRPEVPWAHGTCARELRVRRSPRKLRGGMNTKTQRLTGERERWWSRAARPERPCRPSRIEAPVGSGQ